MTTSPRMALQPITYGDLHFAVSIITGYRMVRIGTDWQHVTDTVGVDLETGERVTLTVPTDDLLTKPELLRTR